MNDRIEKTSLNRKLLSYTFVLGMLAGVAGTVYVPRLVRSYMPRTLVDEPTLLHGTVTAKQSELDRLLLTVTTGEGTVLATYTEGLAEIDLMVNEGDSITLAVDEYKPFLDNPTIARVGTPSRPEDAAFRRNDAAGDSSRIDTVVSEPDTIRAAATSSMVTSPASALISSIRYIERPIPKQRGSRTHP